MKNHVSYLLDRYHNRELSPDEQVEFDHAMKDEEFRRIVEVSDAYQSATSGVKRENFHEKMMSWESETETHKSNSLIWWIIGIGIVISGLTYFYLNYTSENKDVPQEKIYQAYLKPFDNVYAPLQRSGVDDAIIDKAFAAYEAGDFDASAQFFISVPNYSVDDGLQFYHAVSLLHLDETNSATDIFTSIAQSSEFYTPSVWYRYLIAVRDNNQTLRNDLASELLAQEEFPRIGSRVRSIEGEIRE